MARASGLSTSTVQWIWRALGFQPHREGSFKLSTDPDFVDKVRDVIGLYVTPPAHAVVLCVDEKSQIQALDRSQSLLPMRPGQIAKRTHDYQRHDKTSLFAAPNPSDGQNPPTTYSLPSNASASGICLSELQVWDTRSEQRCAICRLSC